MASLKRSSDEISGTESAHVVDTLVVAEEEEEEIEYEEHRGINLCKETYPTEKQIKKKSATWNEYKVPILSNWNFKGGVGKTSTTFALAYSLAHSKGKKVLMVDADPQKNLTQLVASYYIEKNNFADSEQVMDELDENKTGFYHAMLKAMRSNEIKPAEIVKISIETVGGMDQQYGASGANKAENIGDNIEGSLFLLSGSYKTALLDASLLSGYNADVTTPAGPNMLAYPAVFYNLIRITAACYGIDYVLIDLSPAISYLNTNILLSSNAFILPCSPEKFSVEALTSLPELLNEGGYYSLYNKWKATFSSYVDDPINLDQLQLIRTPMRRPYFGYPQHTAQLLGAVITRYDYSSISKRNNTNPTYDYRPKGNQLVPRIGQLRATLERIVALPVVQATGALTTNPTLIPPNINRHLPQAMTVMIRELGWAAGHYPHYYGNVIDSTGLPEFPMILGSIPELHQLALIGQSHSIPVAYLSNRLLTKKRCNDPTRKRLRRHHREILEIIADKIIAHVV